MNLKPTLLATGLALALGATALTPQVANATGTGTITFTGTVSSQTCNVLSTPPVTTPPPGTDPGAANGTGTAASFTVTLPTVLTSQLATSTTTYGATPFALYLTGCTAGAKVGAQFYNTTDTDTTTGTVKNVASSGAANVDVQILSTTGAVGTSATGATSGGTAVTIATAQPTGNANVTDQTTVGSTGDVVMNYYAQYYATGAATAGAVSANASYVINYQ